MAFFPCIYFEAMQGSYYSMDSNNLRNLDKALKYDTVIKRVMKRERFYTLLYKLFAICEIRGLRMVFENPATKPHYLLHTQNFIPYTFIDNDRTKRGDYFKKPTAYWFVNCKPTQGFTIQRPKEIKVISKCKQSKTAGLCSEERSMISPDYARNFICDFILGKKQNIGQLQLF